MRIRTFNRPPRPRGRGNGRALIAVAAAVLLTSAAWGAPAAAAEPAATIPKGAFSQPPEVLVHQAGLVVVARLTSLGSPRPMKVTLPDNPEPVTRHYARARAKVERVLKAGRAAANVKPGGTVEFEALALARRGNGSGGRGPYLPVVQRGPQYVLVLRRFADREEWFLPFEWQHYQQASAPMIDQLVKAADVSAWPWGTPAGGLQVAIICKFTRWPHTVRGRETIFFRTYVALRNASRRPIAVNLSAKDAPLWIEARDPHGRAVRADPYRAVRVRMRDDLPEGTLTLAPGEAAFVSVSGAKAEQIEATLDLPVGPWTVQAGIEGPPAADANSVPPLWTGQAVSRPLKIDVTARALPRQSTGATDRP